MPSPSPSAGLPTPRGLRLHAEGLAETRSGPVGLLRDLQDLHLLATLVQTSWTVAIQAAQGARDRELLAVAQHCAAETSRQLAWLTTQVKTISPQALLVAAGDRGPDRAVRRAS